MPNLAAWRREKVYWKVVNDRTLTDKTGKEAYTFDRVFGPRTINSTIFDQEYQSMIINALRGYNVMIAAYGQTSTGKTHTIKGSKDHPGIIQLAADELFSRLEALKNDETLWNQHFGHVADSLMGSAD